MSEDDLSIQGTLAETTVPDLFRSLVRSGETAVVSLDAIGCNDVIYFQEGRIIYASSTDPDMSLGEVLLRGVQGIEYWSLILRCIGRRDRTLEAVQGVEMKGYTLERNEHDSHILSYF